MEKAVAPNCPKENGRMPSSEETYRDIRRDAFVAALVEGDVGG
jgi:hypothetical protein